MYHRRFYPDDVDASVCYVAPLNFSDEEPRVYTFLENVGDQECRDKMLKFQKTVLKKKNELLPLFKEYSQEKNTRIKLGQIQHMNIVFWNIHSHSGNGMIWIALISRMKMLKIKYCSII